MFPTIPLAPFDVAGFYRRQKSRADAQRRKRLERQGIREMLALEDNVLRDIGVRRDDVEHVARLPYAENPSLTLWRLSSRNARRW